ncbi:acyltransferase family protein [Brevibacterium samyangense]|uniref:Acyltransferase family protein n=1 Tax=Brevibacterium samyangense TaxID=366888 RepID=A0ABN2T7W3_9MICO
MNDAPPHPRRFRPEIQALRAVAVLTVVVYHINPEWLRGGFVGVDVFFVISGYLITAHMLAEVTRTGRLSLAGFWANRARRILPAATVTLAATALASPLFLPRTQWDLTAVQGIASAFYVQNVALASQSVDYLRQDAASTPFQHFWSLSIEEQFYLGWPLLVLLALLMFRRRFRTGVFTLFALVVLASFVYGTVRVDAGDPRAYYSTAVRVWELGIGGLLACVLGDPVRFPKARTALAIVGFGAVLVSAVVYHDGTPFPGLSALLPTLGCLAVIAAGRTGLDRVLRLRPLQFLGDRSYSLYLWHYPAVVFYVAVRGHHPGPVFGLCLLVLCLIAADLSYRYVENPVRRSEYLRRRPWTVAIGAVTAMAVAASCAVVPHGLHTRAVARAEEGAARLVADPPPAFGAGSLQPESFDAFVAGYGEAIVPTPEAAAEDLPRFPECPGTPAEARSPTVEECVVANPAGSRTLVVVGDSYAEQWMPAIEEVVRGTDWKVIAFIHHSCPFNLEPRGWETDGVLHCTEVNRGTLSRILELRPEKVLMSNQSYTDLASLSTEEPRGVTGYLDVMRPMAEAGIDVIALGSTPVRPRGEMVPDCVVQHHDDLSACTMARSEGREETDANRTFRTAAELVDGVRWESLGDRICTDTECPAVVGSVLVVRDDSHLTTTYVRTLVPEVAAILDLD